MAISHSLMSMLYRLDMVLLCWWFVRVVARSDCRELTPKVLKLNWGMSRPELVLLFKSYSYSYTYSYSLVSTWLSVGMNAPDCLELNF